MQVVGSHGVSLLKLPEVDKGLHSVLGAQLGVVTIICVNILNSRRQHTLLGDGNDRQILKYRGLGTLGADLDLFSILWQSLSHCNLWILVKHI